LRQGTFSQTLLFGLLSLSIGGCESEAERQREANRSVQAKTVFSADGSIHLTGEQVQANGLRSAPVVEQLIAPTIKAIGRVKARAGGETQVFSPFAGRLIADPARLPRIGARVTKDQVLAEVEQLVTASEKVQFAATAAQLQSALDQAKQEVQLRQTELERAKQLYEGGAIPLKQFQTAEFQLKQAQAQLEGATRARLQYEGILSQQNGGPRRAAIRAPISGTVVAADLTAGQQIDTTKSLLTIADMSTVWVEAAVHESDLPLARRARQVEFTTPANPGKTYTGKLVTIGDVVDPANRTLQVIFATSNPDSSLKLGMTAEVRIPTGPSEKALLIPDSALLSAEGQSAVFVERAPGVFQQRVIATGERRGQSIVVRSGLKAGEKVVATGAGLLRSETLRGQIPTETEGEKR